MTLEETKDSIVKEYGYKSFEEFDDKSTFTYDHRTPEIIDKIAIAYAQQKCLEQRELCANNAGIKILWCAHIMQKFPELNTNINRIIAPESILNALEPEYN